METTVQRGGAAVDGPTEDNPEIGAISVVGVPVFSPVQHWVEAGDHVFRSPELGVVAGDRDLRRAVDVFVGKVHDLRDFLNDLEDPTDSERELLGAINARLAALTEALERREEERRAKLISLSIGGMRRIGRGQSLRSWRPRSGAPGS
jgi:hypothetical protein